LSFATVSLTNAEITRLLVALVAILIVAHAFGHLFARLRQPPVIGEILGGLLLGPTLFGLLLPAQQAALFPDEGPTPIVLGAVYQLGLLLLMFVAGAEIRGVFHRGERKTAISITATGTVVPFLAGLLFLQFFDATRFYGDAREPTAFVIVFAIGIAVTSIPVISRIMFDLGIIGTSFARVILTAAVIEDVILYVVLAIALGLVAVEQGDDFGLAELLGLSSGSGIAIGYHVVATLAFFAFFLLFGPRLLRAALRFRYSPIRFTSPIAHELTLLFAVTAVCMFLGISGFLGALVAGIVTSNASDDPSRARAAIKNFSFAFFIPVYFGVVGMRLDLVHDFDPLFFLLFFTFACVAKGLSVYAGARLAGENPFASTNLAVAMNARGGPGIVLATVAFDAAIINEEFYAALILLVLITSFAAGMWLERAIRTGRPLRDEDPERMVVAEEREQASRA
jgi:Kef-type K+ transport system membrane component KefB